MEGADKPLLAWQDHPMVDWILDSLPPEADVLISANRNIEAYTTRAEVVQDSTDYAANASPLVGIYSGLVATQSRWLLVCPGDTPKLTGEWWQPLLAACGPDGAVIHDGIRQQHLHLLLSTGVEPSLKAYLDGGNHEVWRWLDSLELNVVQSDRQTQFDNVNTFAELKEE